MTAPAITDIQTLVAAVQDALAVSESTTFGTAPNNALDAAVAAAQASIQAGQAGANDDMVGLMARSAITGTPNPNRTPTRAVLLLNAMAVTTAYLATVYSVAGYVGRLKINLDNI